MSLGEAAFLMPLPWRVWFVWLVGVMLVCPAVMLLHRRARVEGAVALATGLLTLAVVSAMHGAMGYVRLLSLPHLILWVPLLLWLVPRLPPMPRAARLAGWIFAATVGACLLIDFVDVARWLLGDRAAVVGG